MVWRGKWAGAPIYIEIGFFLRISFASSAFPFSAARKNILSIRSICSERKKEKQKESKGKIMKGNHECLQVNFTFTEKTQVINTKDGLDS